jgi:hypothetical protein
MFSGRSTSAVLTRLSKVSIPSKPLTSHGSAIPRVQRQDGTLFIRVGSPYRFWKLEQRLKANANQILSSDDEIISYEKRCRKT